MFAIKNKFLGGLIDIRFKNDTAYFYQEFEFELGEIEAQIKNISYTGNNRVKDPKVENIKLPPFIIAFYKFLFFNKRIPNEHEITEAYINECFKPLGNDSLSLERKGEGVELVREAVVARLLRSYPSLIRDFHFYCLVKDSKFFDSVTYSLNVDYFEGADLIVEKGNEEFYVSLFVNSKRAKYFKSKKYKRHDYANMKEIKMVINFNELNKVSDFYLYGKAHLQKLKEKVGSYLEEK